MGCGMSMVKYILFLFNLLCAICGILIIVFGALLFTNVSIHSASDLTETITSQQLPVALIVLGGIILLISFFGCCGAIRESSCMSITYAILLFVLLIVQIGLVVFAFMKKDAFLEKTGEVIDTLWEKSNRNGTADYMTVIQISYKCCGNAGPQDYAAEIFKGRFPKSCCIEPTKDSCNLLGGGIYMNGCRKTFIQWWDKNWDILQIGALVVAAIEFIGLVFACCLANNVRNYRRRQAY